MMPLNWGVEMIKWKILTEKLEKISALQLMKSILIGVSLGMITPKRTGEFAGRIMVLSPSNRLKGLLLNTAGSLSQLSVTLIMGSLGLLAIFLFLPEKLSATPVFLFERKYFLFSICIFSSIGIPTALILISQIRYRFTAKNKISALINFTLDAFSGIASKDMFHLFALSFLRYCIFATQFWLLLLLSGIFIPYFIFISLVAVVYLFMAVIPLSAIWEPAIRGSVALLVFGLYFGSDVLFQPALLAASTGLWAINLAIPALTGSMLVMRKNVFNQNTGS